MDSLIQSFGRLSDPHTARQLRHAVQQLSIRGLVQSATWAAELLASLPAATIAAANTTSVSSASSAGDHVSAVEGDAETQSVSYLLARSYFDTRQYRRVAHTLWNDERSSSRNNLNRFLGMYSLYLAGERRREEDRMELADWTEPSNVELPTLRIQLDYLIEAQEMDAFLWYLYGVILKRLRQSEKAIDALVSSLRLFPYNQGAWLELAPLCETRRAAEALQLPPHFMKSIFIGSILNDTEGSDEARQLFEAFVAAVPSCRFAKLQLAISLYHVRMFDESQHLFAQIYADDEFCLDGVDIYSNILYVKEDKVELSVLANKCIKIDKFRLETCCVIGNYYSMRGQHDQALAYFQRALRINRNYLSAWTLMGHEFLEMTNTAAAVEAYRRAVDINPKDFRAWYGLGQTYELLNMPMYTLYYYQKAAALRPRDARMWCAVAQTYQELRKYDEATKCFERAVGCDDREGLALSKLASLYDRRARESKRDGRQHEQTAIYMDKAAKYHEANLERIDEEKVRGPQNIEALRFLAEYYFNKGDMTKARDYGKRLLDCPGHDKDFLKTLMRQIHSQETQK